MRKPIVLLVCAVLGATLALPGASSAHEDACPTPTFSLVDWAEPAWGDEVMYVGIEGTSTPFQIQRGGDDCTDNKSTVSYEVDPATASDSDFVASGGSVEMVGDGTHAPVTKTESVILTADSEPEGVEHVVVTLTGTNYGRIVPQSSAKLHILDDDGQERIGFIPQQFSRNEFFDSVRIPVFRWGDVSQATTLDYTVTGGPGEPATPGTDTTPGVDIGEGGSVQFAARENWTWITIPLFDDDIAEPSEHATVKLSGPTVTAPDSATVTIEDNEESTPPTSKFHHPKNKYAYAYNDFRIREVHVFTDDVGSGVLRAEWALRKNMTSGKCQWWSGGKWAGGSCSARKWLRMKKYGPDFFYTRLRPLSTSVRSRIKNYTAFSKALDRAGNWEKRAIVGRNANTFEVKRKS